MKRPNFRFPFVDLIELSILIAAMVALAFYDPFRVTYKIIEFLKLKYIIFIREPKLLYYASVYIGSFIAKGLAIILITILLILRRVDIDENLALKAPKSNRWKKFVAAFIVLSVLLRIYYSQNPLIPNLPIRLVFPEAMIVGNAIIILSILFVAPIAEEIIFRGYMYDILNRIFGPVLSILATSLLFTIAHFSKFNLEVLDYAIFFILGLIFGIARYKSGSTLVPMAFHGIYNLVYVIVGSIGYFIFGY